MGDVGIESTLVLDGLAVSKVRFYSTLDSDVGKTVEITDKFNPSNVFTGTFDESLNLLYDLPAFTSYEVKMYGLDGETVESDQTFMLKGYDYLEMNVGLNKNSFAGIKAIVDQGLEDSMIEIGHEFSEDDNVGDDGGRWIVVAKDYDPDYRHSVFLARHYAINNPITESHGMFAKPESAFDRYLNESYYEALPASIKNAITSRNVISYFNQANQTDGIQKQALEKVWSPSFVERWGSKTFNISFNNVNYSSKPKASESNNQTQFQYYANNPTVYQGGTQIGLNIYLRSLLYSMGIGNDYWAPSYIASNINTQYSQYNAWMAVYSTGTSNINVLPHMMIASDPIE